MDAVQRAGEVIEIAGLAGSGKSTLVDTLTARRSIHLGVRPCDPTCLPLVLRRLRLVPVGFLWNEFRRGRIPREPLLSMVYLDSWLRDLSGTEYEDSVPVLYDHGPFFRLATIDAFGPPAGAGHRNWWESMREAWSGAMTLVVWLDAPDALLLKRIRGRNRGHPCEAMTDNEALVWLGRYRVAFESSLAVFQQRRPADLIRFDTSSMSPDEIAESIIDLIEARGG